MEQKDKAGEIDFREYWQIIVRRKWVLAIFAGTLFVFALLFSLSTTPRYRAKATVLIEEESSRMLSVEEAFSDQTQVFRDLRGYNTQMQLLRSRSLMERVAKKLNLPDRPEFSGGKGSKRGLLSRLKYVITLKWLFSAGGSKKQPEGVLSPTDPYLKAANALLEKVQITPIQETKIVEIGYAISSPILAAEIVNTLAEEFINFSSEKRIATTQQASDWLTEQINNLRNDLTAKERELLTYGQEKDILFLSENESSAVKSFSDLNDAYNRAVLERINTEAEWRALKNLQAGSVPQVINDPAIAGLKTEYTRLRAEFDEKSRRLKADHPEMLQIKARLDSLKGEIIKAADAAEARYRSALQKENSIRAAREKRRADVGLMENNSIMYNSIRSEVESKRRLLSSLQERQSETQLSAQLKDLSTSNISIIDKADVPQKPFSPDMKKNLLVSLLIGLFGGVGLCFLLDFLDDTIKGPADLERLAGIAPLGIVPYLSPDGLAQGKGHRSSLSYRHVRSADGKEKDDAVPNVKEIELINHLYPELPFAEDYRTIRTSILLSHVDKNPKTIVFSSPLTQEGKSATTANLAVAFAQLDKKVLVIDADLRRPRMHRIFKARNLNGLTGFLIGNTPFKEVIEKTLINNIWLMPCGPIPPNPAELVNSRRLRELVEAVGQVFDIILLDSPPVLAVSDTTFISSVVESVVLVVRSGQTRRKPLLYALKELARARANVLGVILNGIELNKEGSFYGKYYRYSSYGGEEVDLSPKKS